MSVSDVEREMDLGPADRLPPQDVSAEKSVLGSMMLSKDAISDCAEGLRASDFYRPAHEMIYDAIADLFGRGEPVDAITVADELTKRGQLQRVGGHAYIHDLIQSVPTSANAAYYAEIVAERAVLRRLVDAGTRIVQMGYAQEGDVVDVVNAAQAEVYAVADKRGSEDYAPLSELLEATLHEIEVASGRSDEMTGVPTGFIELDELTHGLHPGQMIVIAARPAVGKSTIGLDIARAAAIKHGMATAVFSLEMSKTEITMRVLSAEASLQLQDLRKGTLRDEGWQKLARVMGDISVAPLYIDDSPNMTLMEIRAKCRRLKQLHNLKLVVIDYLQLMTSGKKVESRQQEVSEFSRAIKLLAKELDVPVIAISQLNRGPEQRTDKRPQMSDLRESGCLPADTAILRADTGAETTIGELYASGAKNIEVWSLDDGLRYRKRTMTHVFSTGVAPVFRLKLASGKTVRATENHPFFTYDGWQPLASLRQGDRIAVPRHVPSPRLVTEWTDEDVTGAARLSAVAGLPVPTEAFSLPKAQIARLLSEMYAVAGSVRELGGDLGCVHLTTVSRQVADSVARLLLRFGISSRVVEGALIVDHGDSIRRLCQEIGVRDAGAAGLLAKVKAVQAAEIEKQVLEDLEDIMAGESVTRSVLAGACHAPEAGTVAIAEAPSSARPALLAEALSSADIELSAINDVEWDTVVDVEPAGVEEVFDATVLGSHNFVADGISVHNSIEQDADMVILLHRDRDPASGKEGEADVIVAKHRNGPTRDITLAFQGHFSRFANMAQNF